MSESMQPDDGRTDAPVPDASQSLERPPSRLTQPLAVVLLAVAALLVTVAVVVPIVRLAGETAATTVNLSQPATDRALATVPDLPGNVTPTATDENGLTVNLHATGIEASDCTGRLPCTAPPWWLRLLTDLGTSLWAAGLAVVAYLLARILGNIAHGDPFHPSHPRRISVIAGAILLASVGADTVNLLSSWLFVEFYDSPGSISVVGYYSFIPLGIAAVTAVMAGAFRTGRRMAEDVEGLV